MTNLKERIVKMTLVKKILFFAVLFIAGFFVLGKISNGEKNKVTYETAVVERGTLVVTVQGSGTVASTNNSNVTTSATGVVKTLFVKDGDTVETGDKIAEIDLDLEGRQKNAQAYASYLSAQNNLQSAKDSLFAAQADLFTKWQTYFDLAESTAYKNDDGTAKTEERNNKTEYLITEDNWLSSEAKYKGQQKAVTQAETALSSAWYSYQQASPVIYAPISGTVSGFSLQIGSVINSQSSSNTTATTNKIAGIKTSAMPTISINLTEIDVPKIKVGDRATVTFDAFSEKTFTGRVVSVDLIGSVSSGVTTYPTVILLDTKSNEILPNMAASANIITDTKTDVLMIPVSAVTKTDDATTVRVMKNGKPETVNVETGLSSDDYFEIVSGLKEGDSVVTSTSTTGASSENTNRSTSPFGGFGGGNVRMITR